LPGYFQGLYQRRIEREYALNAHSAAGDAPDGEVGGGTLAVLTPDYHSLERLNALPVAFSNAEVDSHGVPGPKVGDFRVGFQLDQLGSIHKVTFPVSIEISREINSRDDGLQVNVHLSGAD
jgi:hypothetical protein